MNPFFKFFRLLILLLAAALPLQGYAQTPAEGREYRTLQVTQPTEKNRVEVIEFFWYACPHCFAMQPALDPWIKQLPKDVLFKRVPVAFDDSSIPHSRMFYTLEGLGKLQTLHMKAFNAIHLEKNRMATAQAQADYFAREGIDRQTYLNMYNSFSVQAKVNTAQQIWKSYRVDGTPDLAIAGRYLTSPLRAGSIGASLQAADWLVAKSRKEQGLNTVSR